MSIYLMIPITIRIVSTSCYLSPNFSTDYSLRLFAVLLSIPIRSLITGSTIFTSILLCIFLVQLLRISNTFKPNGWNLAVSVVIILITIVNCLLFLAICIVQFVDFSIYVSQNTNHWDQFINNVTLPITSSLMYTTVFIFCNFLICMFIPFVTISSYIAFLFNKTRLRILQLIEQREQFAILELQDSTAEVLLDQMLHPPTNESVMYSTKEASLHFKHVYSKFIKFCIGLAIIFILGIANICINILIGLGTTVWQEAFKLTSVLSRLVGMSIIVIAILSKDWISSFYADVVVLKMILMQQQELFNKQQEEVKRES